MGIFEPCTITLENISEKLSNTPPKSADIGNTIICLAPNIFLAICGDTKSTKPIIPVKATKTAVMNEETSIKNILIFLASTPKDKLVSSPKVIISKTLEYFINTNKEIKANNIIIKISKIFLTYKVPNCHNII